MTALDFANKVIIIPIVSTANVAQLAVDLIIATFELQRVSLLDSRLCVPIVGAREDGKKGIITPLEVYGRSDLGFVVLQQRSPALKFRKQEFVNYLLDFVKASKFSAALFLSGLDLSNRTDAQMMTPTHQIIPPQTPPLAATPLQKLNSLPIPVYSAPTETTDTGSIPFIPGGGLTRRILASILGGYQIPVGCLLQFVIEGDNRLDAGLLASVVSRVLANETSNLNWKQPSSWARGLFGTPHDQTLYG